MFPHETAKSRKVCGYAGNAHHGTFSCQKKWAKNISGQHALNGFILREPNTRAALKMSSENYYALLWIWRKRKKEKEILKRKFHTVLANVSLCFSTAKLKNVWETRVETENLNIWSGLFVWILN